MQFNIGKKQTSEFTFGARGDVVLNEMIDAFFLHFTVGAGLSRDLDRWAIRPEVGAIFNPELGGTLLTFGVGANFSL